jgi:protein tyrosine/serine phosphatase
MRALGTLVGCVVVAGLVVAPALFAVRQKTETRNLRVVREGVLYRSGQMSVEGLRRMIHDYGIRTVVSLRDGIAALDLAEERFCATEQVKFVRLPPLLWAEVDGAVPIEQNLRVFRAVLSDPRNYPVLVHCFAGIHRTGGYCAVYRMEFEGWSNEQAIAELRGCGYTVIEQHKDILGYLERYRPGGRAAADTQARAAAEGGLNGR